jgi:hypothetical protein
MKVFRELAVELQRMAAADFVALLEKHAANGWARDAALEARLRRHGTQPRPFYLFTRQGHPTLSPAHLALVDQEQDRLVVSNVFSESKGELTHDEYNGLLMEFHDAVIAPVSTACGAAVRLTPGEVSLRDILPPEVFDRLQVFSSSAERIGGVILPRDMAQWLDFIAEVYGRHCTLEPRLLGRWLREEEHWSEEAAARLTEEYERGRELLAVYDRRAG